MNRLVKFLLVCFILLTVIFALSGYLAYRKTLKSLLPHQAFNLYDTGTERIVDYGKYGEFRNILQENYSYRIKNRKLLAKAAGEGIYPNTSVYKDPRYKTLLKQDQLKGTHWDFIDTENPELSFYKWATASEEPGVRQFYTALALENAQLINQAIKAYYAVIVHYPKTVSFTYWNTPWYPSKVCIERIKFLTRKYPVLGMKIVGADVLIENGYNLDPQDDKFFVNPGKIIKCKPRHVIECQDVKRLSVVEEQKGYGNVNLIKYKGGDWQLFVDGKPFLVKAVAYTPAKIGQSPDEGTLDDWMNADYNSNEIIDGPYEAWVDENENNIKDGNEMATGDFKLMKDMGVNTVRIYDHQLNSNKMLLRKMHEQYGFMVIMGDVLGAYAIGSGTTWYRGTNYADPEHRKNLKARVRKMIETYKNEPYVVMWMLGNENNYGVANSAKRFPKDYYKFVNEVALMIKEIDQNHPVALCNGDTLYLDYFAEHCPDVDIYGANSYRGWQGFGFWNEVKTLCGKPVIITEYGAPAKWDGHTRDEGELAQADYHEGAWSDIYYNSAGHGSGNALGGVIFEWVDEWWKAYEPFLHDAHKQWPGPFRGGWMLEEWLGLTSQGDGKNSPYQRQLRASYFRYKYLWNPDFVDRMKKIWYNIVVKLS